jgi:hypothetical protein
MYEYVTTWCLYTCKTFTQNLATVADITNIHIFGFFSRTVSHWDIGPIEFWMIFRRPGFLEVVWFGSSPALPPLPSWKRDRQHTGKLRMMNNFLTGDEGKGWARRRIIWPQESLLLNYLLVLRKPGSLKNIQYFLVPCKPSRAHPKSRAPVARRVQVQLRPLWCRV